MGSVIFWIVAILFILWCCRARGEQITFIWEPNPPPAVTGYRLYRLEKTLLAETALTTATVEASPNQWFVVSAYNEAGESPLSTPPVVVPKAKPVFTVTTSSEAGIFPSANAIDGKPATTWISKYDPEPPDPQWIELDLGGDFWVSAVKYLPRQDGYTPGHLESWQVLADGAVVASGEFKTVDTAEKTLTIPKTRCRKVRLLSAQTHLACAELSITLAPPSMVLIQQEYGTDLKSWTPLGPVFLEQKDKGFVRAKLITPIP